MNPWKSTPAGGVERDHDGGRIVVHRHGRVRGKWAAIELPKGRMITPSNAEHLPPGVYRERAGWDSIEQAKAEIDDRFKETA